MYRTPGSNVIALKDVFNKLIAPIPAETEGLQDNLDAATALIEATVLTDKNFVPEGPLRERETRTKRRHSRYRRRNYSGSDDDESCRELSPTDVRHRIRAHDLRNRLNSKHQDRSPWRERDDYYYESTRGRRSPPGIKVGPKAFTRRLTEVDWPEHFKPGAIENYDGTMEPTQWLGCIS